MFNSNFLKITKQKLVGILAFIILVGVITTGFLYYKHEKQAVEKQKIDFRDSVRELNSNALESTALVVHLIDPSKEFFVLSSEMMSDDSSPKQRMDYAAQYLKQDESFMKDLQDMNSIILYDMNQSLSKVNESAAAVKENNFRQDALKFAADSKELLDKEQKLHDATFNLALLQESIAKDIIRNGGDNHVSFSALTVSSNEEMVATLNTAYNLEPTTIKYDQDFMNQYAILKGRYGLEDLTYSK